MVIGVRPVPEQNFPSFLRNSRKAFNSVHILFLFLSLVTYNISIFCFLMFNATSFTQFSEAGLFYLVGYLHLSFYTVSIWKRSKILSFIDDIEEIIRQSKMNHWKLLPSSEIVSFNWLVCPQEVTIYEFASFTSGRINPQIHFPLQCGIRCFYLPKSSFYPVLSFHSTNILF